ncbi:rhamnan synthesis F family protein [Paenalcaligenes faecalis]|uniref:rhamnan synthesis F family protein n=1 Tax=Paenalcaligenes faecalis TaxID=2980099 RepID=UPI0022B9A117|nr:rhamnan synthesis F family protein [Paenalcaligenes faecalis]
MNEKISNLANAARLIAEKRQQQQQLTIYALNKEIERLEEKIVIYKHEALQALPIESREGLLQEAVLPLQSKKRQVANALQPITPRWIRKKIAKKTILIIDNGGLADTIEKLSKLYYVIVWRLEGSTQPLPETARIERVLTAQFDEALCNQRLLELKEADSPLRLIIVDAFIWQAPLLAAANHYIPVILSFDQPIDKAEIPQWAGMYSKWRVQQSFLWAMHVLCADQQSVDLFLKQKWLPFADFTQVVSKSERTLEWWLEHVPFWIKQYRHLIAQSKYLEKKTEDSTFFLGYQYWSSQSVLRHKMMNFLLRWRLRFEARQIIPGLDMESYEHHHPQLGNTNPAVDYLRRGCPPGPWSWPVVRPTGKHRPSSDRVALHIHAFYIDSLPGILESLGHNSVRPALYISVRNDEDLAVAQRICTDYKAPVHIRAVPNKGRDIGAFLTEFGKELIQQYDIIGHVHTKQSLFHPQRDFITAWQEFLFRNVLGAADQPMADAIVSAMQKDPELGMVFPDDPNVLDWGENREYADLLMEYMGLDAQQLPTTYFKFPVGTMFWIRAAALAPLVELGFDWDDYPAEPLIQDGSILHALERLFGIMPKLVGLKTGLSYTAGLSR